VQNTVRQVGAVFGVAILSSIVTTVYSNNITPLLEGRGLPSAAFDAATESIGGTNEVADRLAASGAVPPQAIAQLRQASIDSFMPALHTATLFSVGLLLIALIIVAVWLPTKAQAAAWGAPSAPPAANAAADQTPVAATAPVPVAVSAATTGGGRHAAPDEAPAGPPAGAHAVGRHARTETEDGGTEGR